MFSLKSSAFYDVDMKVENAYILPDDLYKLIFDFCGPEDLSQISLCSEKFNKIARKLDYKYFYFFEENYCSSYNNYE